jgi:hypothetical protein
MPLSGTGAAGGGCIQPEDESQGSTHGAWPRQTVPAEQPKLLPPRQKEVLDRQEYSPRAQAPVLWVPRQGASPLPAPPRHSVPVAQRNSLPPWQ